MAGGDSLYINSYFATHSRDITPVPMRDDITVLYVPVSSDPEITRCCASVLSAAELQRVERFGRPGDRSLFILRRAFRRFCGARALGGGKPLAQFDFRETANGRPHLVDQPDIWFSFSSCRLGYIGGWSAQYGLGIDIESATADSGLDELALEYFSAAEAAVVRQNVAPAKARTLLRYWTLKEAALKSIGEGLPYGLDAFEFELEPTPRIVKVPLDCGDPGSFSAHLTEATDVCAAVVARSRSL